MQGNGVFHDEQKKRVTLPQIKANAARWLAYSRIGGEVMYPAFVCLTDPVRFKPDIPATALKLVYYIVGGDVYLQLNGGLCVLLGLELPAKTQVSRNPAGLRQLFAGQIRALKGNVRTTNDEQLVEVVPAALVLDLATDVAIQNAVRVFLAHVENTKSYLKSHCKSPEVAAVSVDSVSVDVLDAAVMTMKRSVDAFRQSVASGGRRNVALEQLVAEVGPIAEAVAGDRATLADCKRLAAVVIKCRDELK